MAAAIRNRRKAPTIYERTDRQYNRGFLADAIERLPTGGRLGLAVLDFDFKRLNDAHGHRVGNRALPIVSAVLKRNAHAADIAARRGGEELLVAFPGIFAQAFLALQRTGPADPRTPGRPGQQRLASHRQLWRDSDRTLRAPRLRKGLLRCRCAALGGQVQRQGARHAKLRARCATPAAPNGPPAAPTD
ncbi:diguanylate cyclase, partial [Xanthomonas vasicola]|uniref:diguanylate cyclase n=1 Tax=Xanthomonas vasicola TaxID=56459 RepID=UPI0014593B98|nr:diguanylate cyclase [Xanthomonas vasicola pv. zeae]